MKMLTVRALDEKYSNELAEILSTDEKTASILKSNIASKRLWEKYNAIFQEDTERYYPIIDLSQLNK